MSGFIVGEDRNQRTLFPASLDDYVAEDNPVRVLDYFVDTLKLSELGFSTKAKDTGRPVIWYCESIALKLVSSYRSSLANTVHWLINRVAGLMN